MRNPLLDLGSMPADYRTVCRWTRFYARTEGLINGCLEFDSVFPLSTVRSLFPLRFADVTISLRGSDGEEHDTLVTAPWARLITVANQHLYAFSRELVEMGEATSIFIPEEHAWVILNPDTLRVTLLPDEKDPVLAREVDGQFQPIERPTMRLVEKISPYDERGTSRLTRCLKTLTYRDALREALRKAKRSDSESEELAFLDRQIAACLLGCGGSVVDLHLLRERWLHRRTQLLDLHRTGIAPELSWSEDLDPFWEDPRNLVTRFHKTVGMSAANLALLFNIDRERIEGWIK